METTEKQALTTTINFNASKEKVWQGLTDPKMIKEYFFGTNLETDWKVGSPVIWKGEWDGKTYEDKGKVVEITPGEYVKYTYWSSMSGVEDKPENYNNVTYRLTGEGDKTTLEVTQDGIKDVASKEHSEKNWQALFGELKKLIE
ncbi:MAG: SRPBCC domain-containing protein [Sphingobacteriales bacterium]|nr:MAG: SRPBCC domain-containing protein [Sphingobacteriales bacterium]